MESALLNVGEVLSGKQILLTGCTGFLGKVTLSMLLHRYGEQLGRVHVLVRKGSSASAQQRFFDKVVTGEPFAPLRGQVDLVINCAGLVSFNPSLELGLNVNTIGVRHVVDACLTLGARLVHVSTTFVAGNRSGLVFEDEEIRGYFPKKDELDGRDFSLEQELL